MKLETSIFFLLHLGKMIDVLRGNWSKLLVVTPYSLSMLILAAKRWLPSSTKKLAYKEKIGDYRSHVSKLAMLSTIPIVAATENFRLLHHHRNHVRCLLQKDEES